jgi:threonine dehydrogenase-like Zn-dependent dehydrogenase
MKLSPAARARYAASTGRGAERDTIDGQAGELDVSGSASALATSIEMVRTLGTVVLAGLAGRSAETALRPDQLVWKEIRLQGYVKGEVAYSKALQFISTRGQTYPRLHREPCVLLRPCGRSDHGRQQKGRAGSD